jgi:hypothetical protein
MYVIKYEEKKIQAKTKKLILSLTILETSFKNKESFRRKQG